MTLNDLQALPILQSRGIAHACKEDANTLLYVHACLERFMRGDYGEICEDDTAANNADLEAGDGHVLARYKASGKLTGDIYIEAHFYYEQLDNIDYSNIYIMYPSER